jgi:hypothetical protein
LHEVKEVEGTAKEGRTGLCHWFAQEVCFPIVCIKGVLTTSWLGRRRDSVGSVAEIGLVVSSFFSRNFQRRTSS